MTILAACLNLVSRVTRKAARIPAWLMRSAVALYAQMVHQLVLTLTERYWLIDYLPKKSAGNESVLLVRLDLIGDFVIWLDAAKEFKNLYPNKRIVLYANSTWVGLAEKLSYWDKVIAVDVSRLRADHLYRLGFLAKTRWYGFGIAIQPTYSREFVGDLVIRATQASQRIAHVGDTNNITPDNKVISDTWYTRLISKTAGPEVEFTINAEIIRALGNPDFKSALPNLPALEKLTGEMKIETPYCVIVPGASWAPKSWPVEKFAIVAQQVQARHGLKIVLMGTASEQSVCQQVAASCGGNVLEIAGKTSVSQFVELIRHAVLVVANDSSSVHIAAATGTQAVCILGGGHFGRFLPYQLERVSDDHRLPTVINNEMVCYGCNWRCEYLSKAARVVPCVSGVGLDQVISACDNILLSQAN
jgi:ADP-heptose:LPS heptosyltransferase